MRQAAMCMRESIHVEARGQLFEVCSCLSLSWKAQELNSGYQAGVATAFACKAIPESLFCFLRQGPGM